MKITFTTCFLAALCAGSAFAAPPAPSPKGERQPPPVPPVFAALDTDHDRVLSTGEINAAPEVLAKLDKNGDGEITLDELHLPKPEKPETGDNDDKDEPQGPPPGKRMPMPPVIAALDVDHDGTISAKELENAPDSLKELDKNGDGELSPEELRPHGPPPQGGDRPKRGGSGGRRPPQPPPGEDRGE